MSAPARVLAALDRVRVTEPTVPKVARSATEVPRAVAVMPEHDRERSVCTAADYCAARGYRLAAVADLRVALSMVLDQVADVVVAASDVDLAPLVEIADRPRRPTSARPGQVESALLRRPRPVRDAFGDS